MPIQLENIYVNIAKKNILKNINFTVEKGSITGVIGPNGSGKSTLLKAIANILPTSSGLITVNGKKQRAYRQKEMAKQLSYVPQDTAIGFDFKVKDIVAMGRYVYGSFLKGDDQADEDKIKSAMEQTNTLNLANESVLSLSGGQRQLVIIAKALAQDTPIILLDEPISALDIYYQIHVLSLLKELVRKGKTIIIVLHDLNIASRFCDQLLLLNQGEVEEYGSSKKVLTTALLKKVYHIETKVRADPLVDSITVTPFI